MTLDSDGVTWLMIDGRMAPRRWVIALTRMIMLKSSSATWPWLSPNGASGSTNSVSIDPSTTISESAGTVRSTVLHRTTSIGAPTIPPATATSSSPICNFCGAQ